MSPFSFTLYIDKMLSRLQMSGYGCYKGNATFLLPTVCGMNFF